MAVVDVIKREGTTQGLMLFIKSVTGETPFVNREGDTNNIMWRPGQADKMQAYFENLVYGKKKKDEKPLGVKLDVKPVVLPILLRRVAPWILVYSLSLFLIGRFLPR